ncbi:Uncharacterised protein [Corynebacterium renale]|nr:Uncharacterised protein [Corynebacterium renale]STD01649.1 Uncharacterised protein [Corynebacterium renale]
MPNFCEITFVMNVFMVLYDFITIVIEATINELVALVFIRWVIRRNRKRIAKTQTETESNLE